jgi:hypothetical protein
MPIASLPKRFGLGFLGVKMSSSNVQFRAGERVELRSPAEIAATLDQLGDLDGLPFMPEMTRLVGRGFIVAAQADRVCDTITGDGIRRVADTVMLREVRCDGAEHGGCQAGCLLYVKNAWLQALAADAQPTLRDAADVAALHDRLLAFARDENDGVARFRCQATQALVASNRVSQKSVRSYLGPLTSGQVSAPTFTRVMMRFAVMEVGHRTGRIPDPDIVASGPTAKTPKTEPLGLQPGEWVRVRSKEEIERTLNDKGRNRGLWFDREMLLLSGRVFQVRSRVNRIVDERDGSMTEISSDCVILEGAVCSGQHSLRRWFCPRAIFPYWREAWLERVDAPADTHLPAGSEAETSESRR